MPASFTLTPSAVLADGTYLSALRPPRKTDGDPVTVRIIEYIVTTSATDAPGEASELFVLATTLLDPDSFPAEDLADLYHRRWQAETGIADLKTAQRGGPEHVLRSKKPATVTQELYAMLCVYQAICELIGYAAPPRLDPAHLSFTKAIDAARDRALQPTPLGRRNTTPSHPLPVFAGRAAISQNGVPSIHGSRV